MLSTSAALSAYCGRVGLSGYLQTAVVLLNRHLPVTGGITAEVRRDHEGDNDWLTLLVPVSGDVETIMRGYEDLVVEMSACIPWPECESIHVSLIPA